MNKRDIISYCVAMGFLGQKIDENFLSSMLDELIDSAPSELLDGKTGRVIGYNIHCQEVQGWKHATKGEGDESIK